MASITSLMNSNYNTSSIYGSRNVLTGLASGMDTETMIENAVSGIKTKIQNLLKKRTKVEWQQEAYRSIIDKAVNLNNKYTSYSSKTNLLSSSFFTNSVITTAKGTYADKVTATGKTSSDIKLNAVKQMATAASYTVSGTGTPFAGASGSVTGEAFDLTGETKVSLVSGMLSLRYGGDNGTTFNLTFDELEDLTEGMEGKHSSEQLAAAIQKKLSEITYSYTKNGVQESTTADKAIKVSVENGTITFSDGLNNGNSIKISGAYGDMSRELGISSGDTSIKTTAATILTKKIDTVDFLKDASLSVAYNGASKSIDLRGILNSDEFTKATDKNAKFADLLQKELDKSFGEGKVKVSSNDAGGLSFTPKNDGDTLSLDGSAVEVLGFENGDSNYVNTGKTLKELLGNQASLFFNAANRVTGKDGNVSYNFTINGSSIKITEDTTLEELMKSINSNAGMGVKVSYSQLTNEFKFTATETGSNSKIEFGGLARSMFGAFGSSISDSFSYTYGLGLEGDESKQVSFDLPDAAYEFTVTKDMTMADVVDKLNKNFSAYGYTASYNELSGQVVMTDANGKTLDLKISAGEGEADEGAELQSVYHANYTTGTDAVMDVTINGKRFENLTRSSNSFDIDGLNITVKDTFNVDGSNKDEDGKSIEPITFETVTDSDKIIDAIREFVNDYNEMATELKNAYSTLPGTKTDGSRYEPLTAEQEDSLTESELEAYNEKAKQGVLFGDTTLSSMYSKLLSAIQPGGADGQALREIGITTSYEDGMTTLSLDESKLRAALDSDLDKVKNAFTKTTEDGSSSNGLMKTLQNTLNTYVKTTGEPKGVLITKAGSVKAPTSLSNNSLNTQMSNIDKEIQRWQNKMSSQIDRFTTQFSRMEQLIAQMSAQSSTLLGLMGGAEGY